jgi:hypothetical protein
MVKFVSVFFIGLCLASGCSAADPITNHFTCNDVCQQYADCYDSSYDVGSCKDKCENEASDSDAKQNKLDDCHDCIGDKSSCAGKTFSCADSCSDFVP